MPAPNGQTEIVNDIPPGTQPANAGNLPATTVSFRPVQFDAASIWQSPFFWIVVGSGLTLLTIWAMKKKL